MGTIHRKYGDPARIRPVWVDAGTDIMGVKHQGIFDKDAPLGQQVTVIDPSTGRSVSVSPGQGGGGSGVPPPSPTGTKRHSWSGVSEAQPAKVWSPGQPLDQGTDSRLQGLAAGSMRVMIPVGQGYGLSIMPDWLFFRVYQQFVASRGRSPRLLTSEAR